MKTRTEAEMVSKEWGRILTKSSKKALKIKYRKEKDKDWLFKALGWKQDGRRA